MASRKDNVTVRWGSREANAKSARKSGAIARGNYRWDRQRVLLAINLLCFLPSSGARERAATLEKFLGWQKQADLANRPQATCLPHKPAYTIFHPNRTVQAEQKRFLIAAKRLALIAFRRSRSRLHFRTRGRRILEISHNREMRQQLIFDADDTLWENNIYFEEAFDEFCEYLAHSSMTPSQVRSVLDEIEIANTKIHGYGSRSFARNLASCLQHLAERDISQADLDAVEQLAEKILERPMELLPGVAETVAELSSRHDLTIFTKGDPEEQKLKIDRSGLASYFQHAAIVKEKNALAYRTLTAQRGFRPEETWMIGNSPKSDINPALEAGLAAVFVPHPRTWGLENEDVPESHPRLLRVQSIRELAAYF